MASENESENYHLKATIKDVANPLVMRTLSVPKTITFHKFHSALQIAFGWTSSHCYKFEVLEPPPAGRKRRASSGSIIVTIAERNFAEFIFPEPPLMLPTMKIETATLQEVLDNPQFAGKLIVYHYDFGDAWELSIVKVGTEEGDGVIKCLDGTGHGVAEDCGGPWGWEDLKSTYRKVSKGEGREKSIRKLRSDERERITWFEEGCSNNSGLDAHQWSKDHVNARLALIRE